MNWKEKFKNVNSNSFENKQLEEIETESYQSLNDLIFMFQHEGIVIDKNSSLDTLFVLEKSYKRLFNSNTEKINSEERGIYERLLALFLGEKLINKYDGKWSLYKGKYYTLNSVVIELPSSKNVDVFLFCKDFFKKKTLKGFNQNKALYTFLNEATKYTLD